MPLTVILPTDELEADCPATIATDPPCTTPPVAEAVIEAMLTEPEIATASTIPPVAAPVPLAVAAVSIAPAVRPRAGIRVTLPPVPEPEPFRVADALMFPRLRLPAAPEPTSTTEPPLRLLAPLAEASID